MMAVQTKYQRRRRIIDVKAWLQVADALEGVRRDDFRDRRYRVSSSASPGYTIKTPDALWPGWDRVKPKRRRFFEAEQPDQWGDRLPIPVLPEEPEKLEPTLERVKPSRSAPPPQLRP